MSTITVDLTIKVKDKFTSSNAENIQWIQMSNFHSLWARTALLRLDKLTATQRRRTAFRALQTVERSAMFRRHSVFAIRDSVQAEGGYKGKSGTFGRKGKGSDCFAKLFG
jgi:hypothetical protein